MDLINYFMRRKGYTLLRTTTVEKLQRLAELEGCKTVDEMLRDILCPGICMNPSCDFTAYVAPSQRRGHCENCETWTVKSCLVLAKII